MRGTYDHWLILLSIIVAIIASFVALDLVSSLVPSRRRKENKKYWLAGGAVALGTGIWSMHFIGILAFRLPIEVLYDIRFTVFSMLVAIIVSGLGLVFGSRDSLGMRGLVGGGLLVGIGIVSMNYIGLEGLQIQPRIRYQPALLALSILIALGAAVLSLWCSHKLRMETIFSAFQKKAGSAVIMGMAIFGMHYTVVAAAQFAPDSVSTAHAPWSINPAGLDGPIGAFTLLFLLGTLLISAHDAYRAAVSAKQMTETTAQLNKASGEVERLSARLVQIQDEERRALAAELHDIVGQELAAVNAELALLRSQLPPGAPADAAERLANASARVRRSVDAVRSVMAQLRPPGLDELGLPAALRWHAAAFEARTGSAPAVSADETLPRPWPKVEDALLRIYLEALTNISKHAKAGQVSVTLEARGGEIVMSVADDGRGFDMTRTARRDEKSGWGLMIMYERALSLGAELRVHSTPGRGARIEVLVPKDKWS
jgi:NO-binding membrane sensor protein with MHYT domain